MHLDKLFQDHEEPSTGWVVWKDGEFQTVAVKPCDERENRETLARLYASLSKSSPHLRSIWNEEIAFRRARNLPGIIDDDRFLHMYARGIAPSLELVKRIYTKLERVYEEHELPLIQVEWNPPDLSFYDVDATPPGILTKLFRSFRLRKDKELLAQIDADLTTLQKLQDPDQKKWLTLAILSHGAIYREMKERPFFLPSFSHEQKLIRYQTRTHFIAEGVKTVSFIPEDPDAPALYICQGTELWPSQSSVLGSLLANFAEHGSATETYARSWRRIHKHLRDLPGKPLVAGHSMGGALAMQIGLYSGEFVQEIYAFNPPMPNERDYLFYHEMSAQARSRIHVIANLDDFAFWRIGAKVIGNVRIYLGKKRWRYEPVGLWDCIFLFPAFFKFIRNVRRAFPAHQRIFALYDNWVSVKLTQKEIEKENKERTGRFDYLSFLPKLYDPMKTLTRWLRKLSKWRYEEDFIRGEIEILAVHERDLIDALTQENRHELEPQLRELRRQKGILIRKILYRK